jgi:hypothetical protein
MSQKMFSQKSSTKREPKNSSPTKLSKLDSTEKSIEMFDSESSVESVGLSKLKGRSLAPMNPSLPDHLKPLDIL